MKKLHLGNELDVLVVTAEVGKAERLAAILTAGGLSYRIAGSGQSAQEIISKDNNFSVAVIDHEIESVHEFTVARAIKEKLPSIQVIALSSDNKIDLALKASNQGIFWLLNEPFESEELLYLITRGLVVHQLLNENLALKAAINGSNSHRKLVGRSDVMRKLMSRIQKISALETSVLLTGDSGTGKTLIASVMHSASSRANAPFTAISCANLPKELLESELFGSEKGAFTGANVARPGAIELCDGGTLFLDEIGELPFELQPKLLTFLQDKRVRRIGGRASKQVNVRIICATNRDLEKAIEKGQFREDLYYRINVLNLRIPSLRERKEDVLELAGSILNRIAQQRSINKIWELTPAAEDLLLRHDWPGNIRELEHTLERATAFAETGCLDAHDLEFSVKIKNLAVSATSVGQTLKDVQAKLIIQTLKHCGNDKRAAASMLGISLKTMYNKIKELGLSSL